MKPSLSELETAYLKASVGKNPPTMAACGGRYLNFVSGTTDYDPEKVYLVTKDGITELIVVDDAEN